MELCWLASENSLPLSRSPAALRKSMRYPSLPHLQIDSHIACTASGFIPDARSLVEYARVQACWHRFTYNEPMNVKALTQTVCDLALEFGESDPNQKRKTMVKTNLVS
jgi:hypothetical protein